MKKLMIAAAIVCATLVSQAALVDWKWTGTMAKGYAGSSDAYAGTVYIFNANSWTQSEILEAFNNGESWTGDAMDSYTTENGKMAAKAAKTLADPASSFTPTRTDGSDKVIDYFYASVVKSGDKDYIFLSQTFSEYLAEADDTRLSGSITSDSASKFSTDTFKDGGWYEAQSVPEPISGTLALLGMGAIALRRKMKKAKKA